MMQILAIGVTIFIILAAVLELIDISPKTKYWLVAIGFIGLYVFIEYLCR